MSNEQRSHQIRIIASVCHEANRQYCNTIGDDSQKPWKDAPEWQQASAIKGVEHHIEFPFAGPADSHNSWLAEKQEKGWKYGPLKDEDKKEHPCFVAFGELPVEQQMKDHIFGGIAKAMIRAMHLRTVPTRGEEVMGVGFNPGGTMAVNEIKSAFANLWDLLDLHSGRHRFVILNREAKKTWDAMNEAERKAEMENPRIKLQNPIQVMDCGRAMASALANIETAQMYAVKSVTR